MIRRLYGYFTNLCSLSASSKIMIDLLIFQLFHEFGFGKTRFQEMGFSA